jgi:hypothetical protein
VIVAWIMDDVEQIFDCGRIDDDEDGTYEEKCWRAR